MLLSFNSSEGLFNIEDDILLFIQNNIREPFLNNTMKFITSLGDKGILWGGTAVALAASQKYRKSGIKLGLSQGIGALITNLATKNAVKRPRPFDVIEGIQTLIPHPTDWSFPSGHTTSSIAAGTLLLMTLPKKYGVPAFITGSLISLSRVYVGVHYPSDVLAGAMAGVFSAIVADKSVDSFVKKRSFADKNGCKRLPLNTQKD